MFAFYKSIIWFYVKLSHVKTVLHPKSRAKTVVRPNISFPTFTPCNTNLNYKLDINKLANEMQQ